MMRLLGGVSDSQRRHGQVLSVQVWICAFLFATIVGDPRQSDAQQPTFKYKLESPTVEEIIITKNEKTPDGKLFKFIDPPFDIRVDGGEPFRFLLGANKKDTSLTSWEQRGLHLSVKLVDWATVKGFKPTIPGRPTTARFIVRYNLADPVLGPYYERPENRQEPDPQTPALVNPIVLDKVVNFTGDVAEYDWSMFDRSPAHRIIVRGLPKKDAQGKLLQGMYTVEVEASVQGFLLPVGGAGRDPVSFSVMRPHAALIGYDYPTEYLNFYFEEGHPPFAVDASYSAVPGAPGAGLPDIAPILTALGPNPSGTANPKNGYDVGLYKNATATAEQVKEYWKGSAVFEWTGHSHNNGLLCYSGPGTALDPQTSWAEQTSILTPVPKELRKQGDFQDFKGAISLFPDLLDTVQLALLGACDTATEIPDLKDKKTGASLSMCTVLLNNGVDMTIGTRGCIDADKWQRFVKAFFDSQFEASESDPDVPMSVKGGWIKALADSGTTSSDILLIWNENGGVDPEKISLRDLPRYGRRVP